MNAEITFQYPPFVPPPGQLILNGEPVRCPQCHGTAFRCSHIIKHDNGTYTQDFTCANCDDSKRT